MLLLADLPARPAPSDHWRKNIPVLAAVGPVFAIDLLGFGFSEKPDPRTLPPGSIYNFENWGQQCADFCRDVVGSPAFLITNSVGGLAGLQAAVTRPEQVRGVVLLDISLRGLHVSKQPAPFRPLIKVRKSHRPCPLPRLSGRKAPVVSTRP